MIRATPRSPSARSNASVLSFVLRATALVALLAIPILGTSYALVSNVSADITMAATEHDELRAFARVIDVVPPLEALHRALADGDGPAVERYRAATSAAFRNAAQGYAAAGLSATTADVWRRWERTWNAVDRRPTIAGVDATLDTLQEIGNELDDDSLLDVDPNFAVQNLTATVQRQTPRSIVAIRHTADALWAARGDRLDARTITRVASSRALERQPLARIFGDLPFAIGRESSLKPYLAAPLATARTATQTFERDVDGILTTLQLRPRDRTDVERLVRNAIDAHIALWRVTLDESDRLVTLRHDAQRARRNVIILLSIVAIVIGALGLTITIRHMARRDRVALAAAKLESDKLRAELQHVSMERALRLQEAQFRSVFENAEFGIAIFNLDGSVAQVNAAVNTILGDRRDTVLANRHEIMTQFAFDRESLALEELHERADGSTQWLAFTFSGVYDGGVCQMVILLVRDTTEEKLLQQGLLHAARHDRLTQIANRAAFEDELAGHVADALTPFALVYVDLDAFKPVNDSFGHAAGDTVLVVVADRLRSSLASSDFCARLGGDEFAAILRGCDDPDRLASIAARVATTVALPIRFGDDFLTVTASIGVAIRSGRHASGDELKIEADRALYAAKAGGGNAYRIAGLAPVLAGPAS